MAQYVYYITMKTRGMGIAHKLIKSRIAFIITMSAILAVIRFLGMSFMEVPEYAFVRASNAIHSTDKIFKKFTIVEINDKSIDKIGAWPWPQKAIYGLLNSIARSQAKIIILDPSVSKSIKSLPRKTKRGPTMPPIVASYHMYRSLQDMPTPPAKPVDSQLGKKNKLLEYLGYPSKPMHDFAIYGSIGMEKIDLMNVRSNSLGFGFYNLTFNHNGMITNQPIAMRQRGYILPSVGIMALSKWKGFSPILITDTEGYPSGVSIGAYTLKTPQDTSIMIGYIGRQGTFHRIDALDVLKNKTVPNPNIAGKIVFICLSTDKSKMFYSTPFGMMDSSEIHANIEASLMTGKFPISLIGKEVVVPLIFILGIIIAFLSNRSHMKYKLIAIVAVPATILITGILLPLLFDVWIPAVQFCVAWFMIMIFAGTWWLFLHIIPKWRLSQKFEGRLSPSAIDELVVDNTPISTNGYNQQITAMSIDIKGFGAICDRLSASDLTTFLAKYRKLVSNYVILHGGMIISWTSDTCRAAFGAPTTLIEHPLRACMAAIDIRKAQKTELAYFYELINMDRINLGVGIQTGTAVAGNFGFGYTLVGGAMEAAEQLRSRCRLYRTWALIGEKTQTQIANAMTLRRLDPIRLWGSDNEETIFELAGGRDVIVPSHSMFNEAMNAYLSGKFEKAEDAFEKIVNLYPNDGPSMLFLKRSKKLRNIHPSKWTGIWNGRF